MPFDLVAGFMSRDAAERRAAAQRAHAQAVSEDTVQDFEAGTSRFAFRDGAAPAERRRMLLAYLHRVYHEGGGTPLLLRAPPGTYTRMAELASAYVRAHPDSRAALACEVGPAIVMRVLREAHDMDEESVLRALRRDCPLLNESLSSEVRSSVEAL